MPDKKRQKTLSGPLWKHRAKRKRKGACNDANGLDTCNTTQRERGQEQICEASNERFHRVSERLRGLIVRTQRDAMRV
jgi:hypothetical protein